MKYQAPNRNSNISRPWLNDEDYEDDEDKVPYQQKPVPQVIRLYPISFPNGSILFMTAAPATIVEAKELAQKALAQRVDTKLVLLEPKEIEIINKTKSILDIYREAGLRTLYYPIKDYSIPTDIPKFNRLIEVILTLLTQKSNVLVHCHGGHGRTGIVVVGCFIRLGKTTNDAFAIVNKVRSVIDTDEQFEFLYDYEEYCIKLRREHELGRGATKDTQ